MMTFLKRTFLFLMITGTAIVGTNIQKAHAQRTNKYQKLAQMSQHPPIFFNTFTLPGHTKGKLLLAVTFNINYKRLSFLKVPGQSDLGSFYSPTALSLDLFHAKKSRSSAYHKLPDQFYNKKKSNKDHIDVSDLSSLAHTAWQDTAYATGYSQTTSPDKSLNGSMQVQVRPGSYIYLVKPGESQGSQGITRRINVSPYTQTPGRNVIFVKSVDNIGNPARLQLINMGHNVLFGKDYYAFIHLPGFKKGTTYQLKIEQVRKHDDDILPIKTVYKQTTSDSKMLTDVRPVLHSNAGGVSLTLKKEAAGYTYALFRVPNHNFENSLYKLTLINKNTSDTTAVDYYQSYWKNMPASLLSLNVAIKMMKYIAPEQTIENIKDGSFQHRKKTFNQFWKAKDPTPKTPFNELQAEYYARIDSAYQKFSTQNTLGYKSSRGKVYILYGPPRHKQRTYPTNKPTRIEWTYPSRKFVFKAVSNLGDFKLIKTIKK